MSELVCTEVSDGVAHSATVARTVTVIPVNAVPILGGFAEGLAPLVYTENDAAVVVGTTITVSDADFMTDTHLEMVTATITMQVLATRLVISIVTGFSSRLTVTMLIQATPIPTIVMMTGLIRLMIVTMLIPRWVR